MDVLTKDQHRFNMSQIRSSNTKPEKIVKDFLKDLKMPFRANVRILLGKPDIYTPSLNIIIQIHVCFWHKHKNCRYFVMPKTN